MLAVKKLSFSSGRYYVEQAQKGEFIQEMPGEKPGVWMGTGAKTFGLGKQVDAQDFRDHLKGYGEDHDRPLVQNAGHSNRVPGWDLTFSVSKSVSILWAVSSREVQREIELRHEQAVRKAIEYLESVSVLRRGQGGRNQERADLIVASFEHSANRVGEPCLHFHAVVVNLGLSKNHTGALHSNFLYEHKMVAGAIYRAELAAGLEQSLGLTLVRTQSWFEVKGITDRYQSLMKAWSSRREGIKEQQPRNAAHAQAIAYATRPKKEALLSRADRFAKWRKEAALHGLTQQKAERLLAPGRTRSKLNQAFQNWCAVRAARKTLVQRQPHFSYADVVKAIALEAPGRGLSANGVLALTDRYLVSRQVMALSQDRFTTKRVWKMEQSMLQSAERLEFARGKRVKSRAIQQVGAECSLTEEQQVALAGLCDRRRLSVLDGTIGSGKTHTLIAAARAYRESGYSVLTVSPSRKEAVELAERMSAVPSRDEQHLSIAQLFSRIDWAKDARRWLPLHKDSVILIDSAERMSTFQLHRLLNEVRSAGCAKVMLVGSTQSMQAIEHGGAFRGIVERLRNQGREVLSLPYSLRQAREQERQMVAQLSDGKALAALQTIAQAGRLRVHQEREDAARSLVAAWATRLDGNVRHHLIITDSKEDACLINHLAQGARKIEGQLGGQSLRVGSLELHEGDRIKFTQGDRLSGIVKGDLATVVKVGRITQSLTVKLDRDGSSRVIQPHKTPRLELGYAVTTHEATSMEPRHSYVFTRGLSREVGIAQMGRAQSSNYLALYGVPKGSPLHRVAHKLAQKRSMDLATSIGQQELVQEQER